MPELPFQSAIMQLTDSSGVVKAENLPVQLDTANIPLNLEAHGMIPTDWYDLYTNYWTSPIPLRTDYFIDQNGNKYSIFGEIGLYVDHLEMRVSKVLGTIP